MQNEAATAQNIKDKRNRLNVSTAIVAINTLLADINKIPSNGLAIYSGVYPGDDGKTTETFLSGEPPRPLSSLLYRCDNKFETEPLAATFDNGPVYGVIIVDGNGVLLATVQNGIPNILTEKSVELPNRQRKGGQSSIRFARLRL